MHDAGVEFGSEFFGAFAPKSAAQRFFREALLFCVSHEVSISDVPSSKKISANDALCCQFETFESKVPNPNFRKRNAEGAFLSAISKSSSKRKIETAYEKFRASLDDAWLTEAPAPVSMNVGPQHEGGGGTGEGGGGYEDEDEDFEKEEKEKERKRKARDGENSTDMSAKRERELYDPRGDAKRRRIVTADEMNALLELVPEELWFAIISRIPDVPSLISMKSVSRATYGILGVILATELPHLLERYPVLLNAFSGNAWRISSTLNLRESNIDDSILESLAGLTSLDVAGNEGIDGSAFSKPELSKDLTRLTWGNDEKSYGALANLTNLTDLTIIDTGDQERTRSDPTVLPQFPALKSLHLVYSPNDDSVDFKNDPESFAVNAAIKKWERKSGRRPSGSSIAPARAIAPSVPEFAETATSSKGKFPASLESFRCTGYKGAFRALTNLSAPYANGLREIIVVERYSRANLMDNVVINLASFPFLEKFVSKGSARVSVVPQEGSPPGTVLPHLSTLHLMCFSGRPVAGEPTQEIWLTDFANAINALPALTDLKFEFAWTVGGSPHSYRVGFPFDALSADVTGRITSLEISGCDYVTDGDLAKFSSLTSLNLNLSDAREQTVNGSFLSSTLGLKKLSIIESRGIEFFGARMAYDEEGGPKWINANNFSFVENTITELSMRCRTFYKEGGGLVFDDAMYFENLEKLDLTLVSGSKAAVKNWGEVLGDMKNLRELSISYVVDGNGRLASGMFGSGDAFYPAGGLTNPKLVKLTVLDCEAITDEFLNDMPFLEEVEIARCPRVSSKAFVNMLYLKKLKWSETADANRSKYATEEKLSDFYDLKALESLILNYVRFANPRSAKQNRTESVKKSLLGLLNSLPSLDATSVRLIRLALENV
jgi:hypothetical protein